MANIAGIVLGSGLVYFGARGALVYSKTANRGTHKFSQSFTWRAPIGPTGIHPDHHAVLLRQLDTTFSGWRRTRGFVSGAMAINPGLLDPRQRHVYAYAAHDVLSQPPAELVRLTMGRIASYARPTQDRTGASVLREINVVFSEAIRKPGWSAGTFAVNAGVALLGAFLVYKGVTSDLVSITGVPKPVGGGRHIQEVSQSFSKDVLSSPIPVLVDFSAPWCAACRAVSPIVAEFAREYQGRVKFVELNVDDHSDIASRYGVERLPTLIFFKNGQVMSRMAPAGSSVAEFKANMRATLDALLVSQ